MPPQSCCSIPSRWQIRLVARYKNVTTTSRRFCVPVPYVCASVLKELTWLPHVWSCIRVVRLADFTSVPEWHHLQRAWMSHDPAVSLWRNEAWFWGIASSHMLLELECPFTYAWMTRLARLPEVHLLRGVPVYINVKNQMSLSIQFRCITPANAAMCTRFVRQEIAVPPKRIT